MTVRMQSISKLSSQRKDKTKEYAHAQTQPPHDELSVSYFMAIKKLCPQRSSHSGYVIDFKEVGWSVSNVGFFRPVAYRLDKVL